ncbi:MAG: SpaH/EbpB family LPXTG-anchored major pilin [Bifidobacterium sp.]|jgi:fimbrial isopeptide formation D2 family protein/LPXTG-motif cell wall-anchored protein|nr:SpaH/EbpB family LPXTG-anchored major pilin [Bifidobacterium sp.]MCI1865848.1 SpaH/EbpB family LPXTG-anchored major pilin [Bifidobacterium sp.]
MSNSHQGVLWHRIAAAAGALALGIAGLVGGVGAAYADGATANPANINPGTPTSLTIHKFDGNPGKAGDGTELSDVSGLGNPLSGVTFSVTPVTSKNGSAINLDTPEGWDLIAGAQASDVTTANGYAFGSASDVTTGADGSVSTTLPHGLYLVTETGYGSNTIKTPVAPFLVTLPLSQNNGSWLYDVHVYPKNAVDTNVPTKTVSDPSDGVVLGSTVNWTISAPVQPDKPGDITSFKITDTLDSRLSFVNATVQGFTATDDYTVSNANGVVTIEFTPTGAAKLKAGDTVTVTLSTKVESLGDGVIPNQATVFTNDNSGHTTSKPGEPGTNPSTNWGPLQVLKYAQGDESKTLAGAEFTVYSDQAATKSVGSFTTGTDGKGSIVLWVGNDADTTQTYYLKETKAPAGYVLDSTVREVTVNAGATAQETYKINNVQQNHPNLPLTGAAGIIVMTLTGLALIAGGVGFYVTSRRHARL